MSELFKDSILKLLFEERQEELSSEILKKSDEKNELIDNIEEKLKDLLKYISDENCEYAKGEIEKIMWQIMLYANFWNESFYKFGITDGINLKRETMELQNSKCINNYCFTDFLEDYIQTEVTKRLKQQEKYRKLISRRNEIKNKYPKVLEFIEDKKTNNLNKEEMEGILEIIEIDDDIVALQQIEIFKIGVKNGARL